MANVNQLDKLEEVVLRALRRRDGIADAIAIHRDVERQIGRKTAIDSIRGALDALEKKGHVSLRLSKSGPQDLSEYGAYRLAATWCLTTS